MKLEDQVVSLELAKNLKELGVEQESLFYWIERCNADGTDYFVYMLANVERPLLKHINIAAAAFTVAELGEMLPKTLASEEFGSLELVWKHDLIGYGQYQFECVFYSVDILPEDTEADARAKMLIYLIENKLINP